MGEKIDNLEVQLSFVGRHRALRHGKLVDIKDYNTRLYKHLSSARNELTNDIMRLPDDEYATPRLLRVRHSMRDASDAVDEGRYDDAQRHVSDAGYSLAPMTMVGFKSQASKHISSAHQMLTNEARPGTVVPDPTGGRVTTTKYVSPSSKGWKPTKPGSMPSRDSRALPGETNAAFIGRMNGG